jgi:two-component system cell cycle response regulator
VRGEPKGWLGGLLATLLARPDEVMLELGAGGELLVARLRAALSALILLLPLVGAATGADVGETVIGLAAAVFVNIAAQVWLVLARQRRQHAWLPYATCTYDVTTTTGVLALLAFGDRVAGMNSMVVWAFYLIAIAMTALRNDGRLTLYAGALSIVQYAALVWILFATATAPGQLVSPDYGTGLVANQLERLILLLIMTVLTACIVHRMQRLVEMSGRDGLTGLPNRMWLLQQMPRLLDGLRGGGSLTLALIDLDRFRHVNDELGRIDGDRALRHAVAVIAQGLHEGERLVRLGGGEFAALLQCPMGTAWERVEQARRILWEEPFQPGRGLDPQRISFSAGLAAWPQDGEDLSPLLAAADRRQQASKRQGGNRVTARDP